MSLSFDPDAVELPFHHFIGGERVAAPGVLDLHRPSDGRPCGACPLADAALVDRAV
jgi:aldehyde dehydrogenase (NAD+)